MEIGRPYKSASLYPENQFQKIFQHTFFFLIEFCFTCSDHPGWLFSCFMYISCLTSACFTNGGGGLVTMSCLTLATQWAVAHQAPLSIRFSRKEYWSGLPFPSLEDLLDPGIEPGLLHCRQILYPYPMIMTDLPTHFPQVPASDSSYQRGGEGCASLLVSWYLMSPPDVSFPIPGNQFPLPLGSNDFHHVLPTIHHTWWGLARGLCFRHVSLPIY